MLSSIVRNYMIAGIQVRVAFCAQICPSKNPPRSLSTSHSVAVTSFPRTPTMLTRLAWQASNAYALA